MTSSINPARFPYNILTQTEVDEHSVNKKVTWNDEELAQNQESPQEKIQALQKEIHEYQCQLKDRKADMSNQEKYIGVILKQFYTRETIIVDYLNKIKDQETLIQQYKKEILQYQEKEKVLLEKHKKNLSIQKSLIETLKQYEAILSPHSNSSDIIIE